MVDICIMKIPFSLPGYVANKYVLAGLVFIVWIGFFDQNKIITQVQYRMELSKLEDEKAFYKKEISKTQQDLEELQSDPKLLEKFAREKYLMKKDNEELFVIVQED